LEKIWKPIVILFFSNRLGKSFDIILLILVPHEAAPAVEVGPAIEVAPAVEVAPDDGSDEEESKKEFIYSLL